MQSGCVQVLSGCRVRSSRMHIGILRRRNINGGADNTDKSDKSRQDIMIELWGSFCCVQGTLNPGKKYDAM